MQGEAVLFMNLKHKCYLQTSFQSLSKDLTDRWTVDCAPLKPGAIWKAAEGIYFPTNSDEFGSADGSRAEDL
jgi:hypothetical protein